MSFDRFEWVCTCKMAFQFWTFKWPTFQMFIEIVSINCSINPKMRYYEIKIIIIIIPAFSPTISCLDRKDFILKLVMPIVIRCWKHCLLCLFVFGILSWILPWQRQMISHFVPVHMRMQSSLSIDILLMLFFFFDSVSDIAIILHPLIRLNFLFSLWRGSPAQSVKICLCFHLVRMDLGDILSLRRLPFFVGCNPFNFVWT